MLHSLQKIPTIPFLEFVGLTTVSHFETMFKSFVTQVLLKINDMLWQCCRRAMKQAAYVTIHENLYVCADTVYYAEFSRFFISSKTVKPTQSVQWTYVCASFF